MQVEGVIVNGRVEFDTPAWLPEGTRVRVEPVLAETPNGKTPGPKQRLVAHTDRPLPAEKLAHELVRISQPCAQSSEPLKHKTDESQYF